MWVAGIARRSWGIAIRGLAVIGSVLFLVLAGSAATAEEFRDCAQCPQMVAIPGGTFLMGSNEELVHRVSVRRFAMGKYEVTFAEWDYCVTAGGCSNRVRGQYGDRGWGRGNRPVIYVIWSEAKQYVAWLSRKTGKRYRLPSEAEWEYAARAGTRTRTKYWWGDTIGSGKANCNGCGSQWDYRKSAPVGSFRPNPFGLYDVHGNVWEWVEDCWNDTYRGAPANGRPWTTGGDCSLRVARGGSWYGYPRTLASGKRFKFATGIRNDSIGFRVASMLSGPTGKIDKLLEEALRKASEERKRAVAKERSRKESTEFRDCTECPQMMMIPGGSFEMGSNTGGNNEKPVHRVRVRPFAMGKYEITFAEWDACEADGGCKRWTEDNGWGRGRRPVINVSWKDAKQYVAWLSRKTGKRYRLPSEAEWEYAARAGTRTKYWWGDEIGSGKANCKRCGSLWDRRKTAPVGSFMPNPFGLYDVHGNVWEWVEDCSPNNRNYTGAPVDGRPWTREGYCGRGLRGGSWQRGPGFLRSAYRFGMGDTGRLSTIGFRVARTLP